MLIIEHRDVGGFIAPVATAASNIPLWLRPAVWRWKRRCQKCIDPEASDNLRKRYAVTTTFGVLTRILGLGGVVKDRAAIDLVLLAADDDVVVPRA